MKTPILAILCLTLCGCVSESIAPYAGKQQDWPTADGAFVSKVKGMDVYHGFPAKPYDYVARIELNTQSDALDLVAEAVTRARKLKADALLFTDQQNTPGSVTSGIGTTMGAKGRTGFSSIFATTSGSHQIQVIAIKFR
jgi:hypothetical protein